jgi:hypothetical protein
MRDHGLTPQRYEAWLARMLLEAVIGTAPGERGQSESGG